MMDFLPSGIQLSYLVASALVHHWAEATGVACNRAAGQFASRDRDADCDRRNVARSVCA